MAGATADDGSAWERIGRAKVGTGGAGAGGATGFRVGCTGAGSAVWGPECSDGDAGTDFASVGGRARRGARVGATVGVAETSRLRWSLGCDGEHSWFIYVMMDWMMDPTRDRFRLRGDRLKMDLFVWDRADAALCSMSSHFRDAIRRRRRD